MHQKKHLKNWEKSGKIKCIKSPGGKIYYYVNTFMIKTEYDEKIDEKESIIKTLNKNIFKKKICYCRVSSHSQKIELNNQIKYMLKKETLVFLMSIKFDKLSYFFPDIYYTSSMSNQYIKIHLHLCTFKTPIIDIFSWDFYEFYSLVYIFLSYYKHLPICSYNILAV